MLNRKVQGWLGSPGTPAPQISLAAFGKHPGWDDHIEDLGLETEALVQARRVLYSEGLGGNIESGAWDKLEDGQRLPGFGHIVIWRKGWDLLIARLWSSSDGKGRSRYPMVLCVHCSAIPLTWAIKEVLPRLEKAQTRCEETPKASDVREIVQATRLKLRTALTASLKEIGSWHGDDVVADRELARLAESPQLQSYTAPSGSPPRTGLMRILYQVDREMAAFAAGSAKEKKSAMASARAQQIRVPSCGVAPGEAGRLWIGVLLETLADGVGIMTIQSLDQRWLDVIVGEPGTANLFCMRASDKTIPLTSDVPYTLDAEFLARGQALVDAWNGVAPKPKTAPATSAPLAADAPHPLRPMRTDAPIVGTGPRGMPLLVILLVALVVVVAAVITFMALRGGPGDAADPFAVPPAPKTTTEATPVAPGPAEKPAPKPPDVPALEVKTTPDSPPAGEPERGQPTTAERVTAEPPVVRPTPQAQPGPESTVPPVVPPLPPTPTPTPTDGQPERPVSPPAPIPEPAPVSAAVITRAVAGGVSLDEPLSPDGPTLGAAAARLEASGGAAGTVGAQIQKLRQIKELQDRRELASLLRQAKTATAFEGFAAWRRLIELGWPGRPEEMTELVEARRQVLALAEGVSDGVRRPALRREFTASARRAALAGLEVCGAAGDEQWRAMLAAAEATGVARAELGPVAQFNTLLMQLRVEIASGAVGDDAAGRARIASVLARAEAMDAALQPRLAELVAALRSATSGEAAGGEAASPKPAPAATPSSGPDLARLGPGSVGWRLVSGGPGDEVVVFEVGDGPGSGPEAAGSDRRPAGRDRIEFGRLPGSTIYLSRDEVPVGVALRAIHRRAAWGEVRKARLLRMFDPAVNDPRPGPRSWDWSLKRAGEAELAAQWLWAGPAEARQRIVSESPADGVPMQHASVDAMVYIASVLGCRLPTLEEWRRAVAAEPASGAAANLRDGAWKRQWEAVSAMKGRADAPPWPDRGAFKPRDMVLAIDDRARPASTEDDGVLWFSAVDVGPGRIFRNLVGNVAEVVFDGPAPSAAAAAQPERVDELLGDRATLRVVGGSALSATELGVDRAWPVDRTPSREGWADVGFRVAFETGDAAAAGTAGPGAGAGSGAAAGTPAGATGGGWARAAAAVARAGYLGRE